LREELHPHGLEIVTVALDTGGADAARPFVDKASPRHPSLLDQAHVVDALFGVVNVPNGLWIDETGMIVRPPEPAFPGRNPVTAKYRDMSLDGLPPEVAEMLGEVKKFRVDPDGYLAMVHDWVAHGAASRYALEPDEVVRRSQPRSLDSARAAAHFELGQHLHRAGDHVRAVVHWREAHRLQPENWTYKRQAWNFEDPVRQGPTDVYDSCWIADVKRFGAENYYPPVVP
jgi:hypothetical protein